MTLLFADGFEDGNQAWVMSNALLTPSGRFGGGMMQNTIGGNGIVGFTPIGAGPYIAGCAMFPVQGGIVMSFPGAVDLFRLTSGAAQVQRSGVALGTSVANVLPLNAWSYVEFKMTVHDTTGIAIVRVNGLEVLNLSGVDTKESAATTVSTLQLGGSSGTGNRFDDVYICDALGTVNNDFLGELTVEHLHPGGDDTVQWLGSDGNSLDNWDLVNEAGSYSGTDYVASSTIGQRDLYTTAPSARPITSPVRGVIVTAVAMKTDAGVRSIKIDVKEGASGTVRQSAELGVPTSFGELRAVFERKADGSAFTVNDVNNLRMGVEVIT